MNLVNSSDLFFFPCLLKDEYYPTHSLPSLEFAIFLWLSPNDNGKCKAVVMAFTLAAADSLM